MKKLNILFLSAIALGMTLTSCSKDEEKGSITGKWEAGTIEGTYSGKAIPADTPDEFLMDTKCTDNKAYYQFDQAGNVHYGLYDSSAATPCSLTVTDATYTMAKNNASFTINFNGKTITCPITSLTATQLKWSQSGTMTDGSTYNIVHVMNKK